jgi:hypothetical protein
MSLRQGGERPPRVCAALAMNGKTRRASIRSVLLALCGLLPLQSCGVLCALLDDEGDHGGDSRSCCQSHPHFSHPYYDPCCHHHR